jgi:hypothetical protein
MKVGGGDVHEDSYKEAVVLSSPSSVSGPRVIPAKGKCRWEMSDLVYLRSGANRGATIPIVRLEGGKKDGGGGRTLRK